MADGVPSGAGASGRKIAPRGSGLAENAENDGCRAGKNAQPRGTGTPPALAEHGLVSCDGEEGTDRGPACKPGSVPVPRHGDGHFSSRPVARPVERPTRGS